MVPSYILAICTKVFALPNPTAAEIADLDKTSPPSDSAPWDQLQMGQYSQVEFDESPRVGSRLMNLRQFLWVPANKWATLVYVLGNNSHLGVAAGPDSNSAVSYHFPCTFEGGTNVIGWHPGRHGELCDRQGVTIRSQSGSSTKAARDDDQILLPTHGLEALIAQESSYRNSLLRYCTIAAKDRGWWVSWGKSDEPCQDAYQECLKTGSANGCQLLGLGDWRVKDRDLLVAVGCANNRIYEQRGNGVEVARTLISQVVLQLLEGKHEMVV